MSGAGLPGRILLTADAVGGVWTFSLELAQGLGALYRERGAPPPEVLLAVAGPPPREGRRAEAAAVPGLRLAECPGRLEWMEEPWEEVRRVGARLLELAAEFRPDLVQLGQYAFASLPWRVPVLVVGHSCVCSWLRAVRGEEAAGPWLRYRREVAAGLRAADLVTAPTRTMLAALRRHYGPFRAGAAVPNGRAAGGFPPGRKEPFVLTAGRLWDEGKNLRLLESAAPALAWPVLAAGPAGPPGCAAAGPPAAGRNGLRLLGELPPGELAGWLGRASIFALPARYEPFGLSALEAGLAGCALVLGDIPSLRETWKGAACFVPPDDAAGLAACLQRLIGDEALRARLAARARRRALRYSAARMAQGYLRLYRRLLREGRHG